jgi:hypothetical protein
LYNSHQIKAAVPGISYHSAYQHSHLQQYFTVLTPDYQHTAANLPNSLFFLLPVTLIINGGCFHVQN